MSLAVREPKYRVNAAYRCFGREPFAKDGNGFFGRENARGLSKRALVQLPCSIGVVKPLSLVVVTYDAEQKGPQGGGRHERHRGRARLPPGRLRLLAAAFKACLMGGWPRHRIR